MEYMTTEQVCGILAKGGVDEVTVGKVFAARLQPQHLDDPEKLFVMGVPDGLGNAFLVTYKFGLGRPQVKKSPLDEDGPDWRPRWVQVIGPLPRQDAEAKAKELTSG